MCNFVKYSEFCDVINEYNFVLFFHCVFFLLLFKHLFATVANLKFRVFIFLTLSREMKSVY